MDLTIFPSYFLDGGGTVFRQMAAKFQANVKKSQRNNVWGSILQEDALTSEMTGIGVGRSLKVCCSNIDCRRTTAWDQSDRR